MSKINKLLSIAALTALASGGAMAQSQDNQSGLFDQQAVSTANRAEVAQGGADAIRHYRFVNRPILDWDQKGKTQSSVSRQEVAREAAKALAAGQILSGNQQRS